MRFRQNLQGNVSDIIKTAEKHIAAGEYSLALDILATARKLDPGNAYILAIIERAQALAQQFDVTESEPESKENKPDVQRERYLSVTVGKEFKNGIKSSEEESSMSDPDVQKQVKRLTTVAVDLFRRGSYETAFDSLMKAYLLDPVSPYVIECEKTLLPAWELLQKRKGFPTGQREPSASDASRLSQLLNKQLKTRNPSSSKVIFPQPTADPSPSDKNPESGSDRLETLMQQKELERSERERAIWREASSPPRILDPNNGSTPPDNPEQSPEGESSQREGFLARWRKKKSSG